MPLFVETHMRIYICIAVFIIAVFSPALGSSFLNWDDNFYILDNPAVTQGLSWGALKLLLVQCVSGIYTPLTTLSFSLEYKLFGPHAIFFHLTNILLHIGVVYLIYTLALRLGFSRIASGIGALIFAVHPMHVESVAWISERKDVLYSVFYLLSIHQYLSYINSKSKKSYALCLVFAFLSVLSKPMALSLPLVLGLIDWYKGRRWDSKSLIEKLPVVGLMALVASISYLLNARNPFQELFHSFLIWAWSLTFYLWKFVWPSTLAPIYNLETPVSLESGGYRAACLALIALAIVIIKFRRNRVFIFALAYFFLSIFFLLRYDSGVDKNIVADRFMYLPSLGICLWLGWCIDRWIQNAQIKWRPYACVGVLIAILAIRAFLQCHIWHDPLTFWNAAIERSPNNFFAYNNRGNLYTSLGMNEPALADYNKALELNPNYSIGYNNRGVLFVALNDDDRALDDFNSVIRLDPSFAEAFYNRSVLLTRRKNYALALRDAKKALARGGNLPSGYIEWLTVQSNPKK